MIDPQAIRSYDFGSATQPVQPRDAILYALGLGLGADPLAEADLRFLDERNLAVLPSFAVTLCSPGMWIGDTALGVDFGKLVHSAHWAEFPVPLPPCAEVTGTARVVSLTDRGEGRGAVLVLERQIADTHDSRIYCRMRQTLLLRGDGGFGGEPAPREERFEPGRPADAALDVTTSVRAALIYRLSGDWNPLHSDPKVAAAAGFPRPILHGLGTYGLSGVAVSRALGRDPAAVSGLACRFSGAVFPGDTLRFSAWRSGKSGARFTAYVGERKVLDDGSISWRDR